MSRHTCHAPGCDAPCPPRHLMCGACWALVPRDVQAEVYRTVRLRGSRVDATWAPWWRAQSGARAAVALHRGADPERVEAVWAKDLAFADRLEAMEVDDV